MKTDLQDFVQALFPDQGTDGKAIDVRREEHTPVIEKWRRTFSSGLHKATGEWRHRGYDWHVFSFGYAKAATGEAAVEQYEHLVKPKGYVFTHTVKDPFCCFTNRAPSYADIVRTLGMFPYLADIYVVDRAFKWTFVVTHETSSGIGPFFSPAA